MNPTLNLIDIAALSPIIILSLAALLMLLLKAFLPHVTQRLGASITILTLLIAIGAEAYAPASSNPLLTPWIHFDSLARFFTLFFLSIGLATTFLADAFFRRFTIDSSEYYFLLLSALFGLILIGSSADFLTLFLGLETLSIALYILCGYMKTWEIGHEASIKYFLIGSLAAAFLLYGIALIYGAIGTTNFEALRVGYDTFTAPQQTTLFLSGIALVTLGLAFKAAIVPFHVWAPDVYDGAPTPVTAFMAVGTKVGAFAAFTRIFIAALPDFDIHWNEAIAWLAIPTLIYANFVALRQFQLRRFFAYSGISHAGFLLIPFAAGTPDALSALLFYLVIYAAATLGAFAVLALLDHHRTGVTIQDLNGLFQRSPVLAGLLALCLLTLAGIPPTAGFFAKFYLFKIAYAAGYITLVVVGLFTAILSAYYYLRIVAVMLSEEPADHRAPQRLWPAAVVGIASAVVIVGVSCYPAPLLAWLGAA